MANGKKRMKSHFLIKQISIYHHWTQIRTKETVAILSLGSFLPLFNVDISIILALSQFVFFDSAVLGFNAFQYFKEASRSLPVLFNRLSREISTTNMRVFQHYCNAVIVVVKKSFRVKISRETLKYHIII